MTVQELIDNLEKVKNKDLTVCMSNQDGEIENEELVIDMEVVKDTVHIDIYGDTVKGDILLLCGYPNF